MDLPLDPAADDRVLVVDDGAVNRMLLVKMLEVLGVAADTAEDGHAAEQALTARAYAAVLMDVRMPGRDGLAATAWLRGRESDRRTPVIAVSAAASQADRDLCRDAGMDGFLAKPVSLADLRRVIAPYVALEPEPATPAGAVDHDRLTDLADQLGDLGLLRETVRVYLAELPGRQTSIAAAVEAEDRDTLRLVSHSLKSSSAMLGATSLSAVCAELEAGSTDAPHPELDSLRRRVDALAPETVAGLEGWLDRS